MQIQYRFAVIYGPTCIFINSFICSTSYEYELIGVTVHTGNADGGHYYAFIKDRTSVKVGRRLSQSQDRTTEQWVI